MKNKKILATLLIILIAFLQLGLNSYAVTAPSLKITSNQYSVGDKMNEDELTDVKLGESIQLYAVMAYGNDMVINNDSNSLGWYVNENNLNGVTWSSEDNSIATVDSSGNVTGVSAGKTNIVAQYNGENASYEINVVDQPSIYFYRNIPSPALIVNNEYTFELAVHAIANTELQNVKFSIENEDIAKIDKKEISDSENIIWVTVKFLKLGDTKLTATLNYNNETYTDSYDINVIESAYTLSLSSKEYTNLPSTLEVGKNIQLTATFNIYGGSVAPEDVTNNGAVWTSSNEKIAKVDSNGLVTAVAEGNATITASFKYGDKTIVATYEVNVTDSTKTKNNSGTTTNTNNSDPTTIKTTLPNTGDNKVVFIGTIISILIISTLLFKCWKKYKDIK